MPASGAPFRRSRQALPAGIQASGPPDATGGPRSFSALVFLVLLRGIRGRKPAREKSCLELQKNRHRSPLSAVAGWQSWP